MPHATINNAKLWYDTMGTGEPLLLHHGYTASRVNWMPVAERLKDKYQIIMMECRGTGESEDTEGGYNIPQYANDVIGLMDFLEIEKLTFAGHSMGGGIGYELGTSHAARLERLILMAPIPSGGTQQTNLDMREIVIKAKEAGNRDFFMAQQVAGKFRDEQTNEWFESRVDHMLRISEGHLIGGAESMHALDLESAISEITTPTLMLAGAVDGLLAANLADYQRMPNATLHVFSRGGHDVAIHEPDGVSQAIDEFMIHGPLSAQILMQRATSV